MTPDSSPHWHYFPPPSLSANWWNLVGLPARLQRLAPHLHHATLNFQAPLWSPCPVVVSLLDLIPITNPGLVTRRHALLFTTLLRPVLRRAARIIVLSEQGRRECESYFPEVAERIRVVPCGLPRRFLAPTPAAEMDEVRTRLELPPEFLLFIGPPETRKNLATLLRALALLDERKQDAIPLVTVGATHRPDPELDALRHRIGRRVIDRGSVAPRDLKALLGLTRGLLFPTRAEGFGYPPLEALSQGTPVIVSDLPVLREVLGEGARYVEPDDPEGWADALVCLAAGEETTRRRTEKGRERSHAFTAERMAAATRRVYDEILG